MKKLIEDPTAYKNDQMPLTSDENKAIGIAAITMICIFLIAGGIIYLLTCK